jgi:signal transduction histidine kinase
LRYCLREVVARTAGLLKQSRGFSDSIHDTRLALEVAVIHRLAERLVAILHSRDPLSEPVHLSKPASLALGAGTVARGLLRRLLRNLLENAQRHGTPPVQVRIAKSSDRVDIEVSDSGPGIPAEERERVFEPFYRRKQPGANIGAGLGLALVRQIARRHGGDVRCEPTAQTPSRFVVQLPG